MLEDMRGFAIVALAACASSSSHPESSPTRVALAPPTAAAEPAPVAAAPPTASRSAPRATPPVRWANIETVENCFYFSGPFNGREENLNGRAAIAIDGARVILRLGGASFEGTLEDEALAVKRVSYREFEGTWKVTETIAGTVREGELRASYRYEECGEGACPGRCTMTADLIGPVERTP
jgi:hypothetical protein